MRGIIKPETFLWFSFYRAAFCGALSMLHIKMFDVKVQFGKTWNILVKLRDQFRMNWTVSDEVFDFIWNFAGIIEFWCFFETTAGRFEVYTRKIPCQDWNLIENGDHIAKIKSLNLSSPPINDKNRILDTNSTKTCFSLLSASSPYPINVKKTISY